jgi:hypothetical protein
MTCLRTQLSPEERKAYDKGINRTLLFYFLIVMPSIIAISYLVVITLGKP